LRLETFGLTGINPIGSLVTETLEAVTFHKGLKADKWDGRISESQSELIRLATLPRIWLARCAVPYPGQKQKPHVIGQEFEICLSYLGIESR
jgi:hypothetical protein